MAIKRLSEDQVPASKEARAGVLVAVTTNECVGPFPRKAVDDIEVGKLFRSAIGDIYVRTDAVPKTNHEWQSICLFHACVGGRARPEGQSSAHSKKEVYEVLGNLKDVVKSGLCIPWGAALKEEANDS